MKDSNPFLTMLRQLRPNLLWDLMIGLPGQVISYDADLQRAVVEVGIQRHEGKGEYKTLPHIEHVPVQFAGSAKWTVFHELPEGTEGYIHFSHRAVDYWLDQGGTARPLDSRMFDASDAFFAPGYRSRKTRIAGLPTTGIGMSNAEGTVQLQLSDAGVKMLAGSQLFELTQTRVEISAGGQMLALGPTGFTHNGVNIGATHKHGGVASGDKKTSIPE